MPRYDMSDLQRFFRHVDTSHVRDANHPEYGPLVWTGKIHRFPQKQGYEIDQWGNDRAPYRDFAYYCVNKTTVMAQRWLFLQMYDDRHLFDESAAEVDIEQISTQRYMHGADAKYASDVHFWWLCRDSHLLKIKARVYDPNRKGQLSVTGGMVRQYPEVMYMMTHEPMRNYMPAGTYERILAEYCGGDPAHMSEIQVSTNRSHRKTITGARSRGGRSRSSAQEEPLPDKSKANPVQRTGKRGLHGPAEFKIFPVHPLIFPEVVGPDRLTLIRHYLNGGTDLDRPFQNLEERNYTVSEHFRSTFPDRAAESDTYHRR